MRSRRTAVLAAALLWGSCSSHESPEIDGPTDRASYSLGYQMGGTLQRRSREIAPDALLRGLRDGLEGATPAVNVAAMNTILMGLEQENVASAQDLDDEKQKLGYSVGYKVGGDFRRQGLGIDPELVVRGVLDAVSGSEPQLKADAMRQTLTELRQQVAAAERQQLDERARSNLAAGQAFLAENGKRQSVTTLPSGLQYEVLEEGGEGDPPTASDRVTVHYRGTLIDGSEFDSSYRKSQPATLPLDRAIHGWSEGLQRMRPGAKYRLFIPPGLAYGERGAGPRIGPNSTLIFEVELLSVQPPG